MEPGLAVRTWADFRSQWRVALAFHLLMQLLGVAIFTPIVTWVGRRSCWPPASPSSAISTSQPSCCRQPASHSSLVIAALSVSLLLAEFAGQSWIAGQAIAAHRATVWSAVAFVLRLLPRLILLSARVFLRLLLLALPFLAAAAVIWFTMLGGHDINYYLAEHPPEWQRAKLIAVALVAAYALLAAWQLARWLYAVPALVFAGVSPARALADSADATRGRVVRIVLPLLLWWLLLTAAAIAITWAFRQVSDAGLDWAGIDVRRVLPLVAVYLVVTLVGGFLYGGLLVAGHQFLVTRMYREQMGGDWRPAEFDTQRRAHPKPRPSRRRRHAGPAGPGLRRRVVRSVPARPRPGGGDHRASRRLVGRARKYDGCIPCCDGGRGDVRRARRPAHSRPPVDRVARRGRDADGRRPPQGAAT